MDTVTLTAARANLGALVNRAQHGHERTLLTDHGKPVAAIVPISDLEDFEDAMALVAHERARRSGTLATGLTHEQFMAELEAESGEA